MGPRRGCSSLSWKDLKVRPKSDALVLCLLVSASMVIVSRVCNEFLSEQRLLHFGLCLGDPPMVQPCTGIRALRS